AGGGRASGSESPQEPRLLRGGSPRPDARPAAAGERVSRHRAMGGTQAVAAVVTPITYRGSCAPVALAALLERPLEEVAGRLYTMGVARWNPAIGQMITNRHAAGDLALRYGWQVEWLNGAGELLLNA